MDSQRLRLGARLGHEFCRQVTGYAGAAWEHEFNGKARATTYGLEAPAPSLKGDSGLLEAGRTLTPVEGSGLSRDSGVQGHTCVRQGVSGTALVRYEFWARGQDVNEGGRETFLEKGSPLNLPHPFQKLLSGRMAGQGTLSACRWLPVPAVVRAGEVCGTGKR